MNEYRDFPANAQAVLVATEAGDGCCVCAELEAFVQKRRSLGAAGRGMNPLDVALEYAAAGIAVIPCEPSSKEPIWSLVPKDLGPDRKPVPRSGGVKKATRDPKLIAEWWTMRPDAMIGAATGPASGFWAIDPDVPKPSKNGHAGKMSADGTAAWAKLKAEHGGHDPTIEVTTPSGGRHIYFKADPARPLGNGEGALSGLGINVRGDGGYVIAPPSRRWPDGKPYEANRPLDPAAIAAAPPWLYELVSPRRKLPPPTPDGSTSAFRYTPENTRKLRDALSYIPAGARDMWLKVGGALNALGHEWGARGREIWDEWSQKEPGSFDADDQDATWEGFDPARPGGATVATIFFEAKERGWKPRLEVNSEAFFRNRPQQGEQKPPSRVIGAGTFMRSYVAISYTLGGILPSGYMYGLTAKQGSGKTAFMIAAALAVALGREDILGCPVERGRVAYVTIENPIDFKMKLAVNCYIHNISYDEVETRIAIIDGRDTPEQIFEGLRLDALANGDFQLVCFDTFQAGFAAANAGAFNDNEAVLRYVIRLRPLTTLPGSPSVLVAFHPTKNAGETELIPYGGGSTLNEVDGNLSLWREGTIKLHHNRLRGPEFEPRFFRIEQLSCPDIVDKSGHQILLPVLRPTTAMDVEERAAVENENSRKILRALLDAPGASERELAQATGISRTTVQRKIGTLKRDGMVELGLNGLGVTGKAKKQLNPTS